MGKRFNAGVRIPEILEHYYQVIINEGIEGASIGKVAQHMGIHPSLIIHYFKNKQNLNVELAGLIVEKFNSPHFLRFDHIKDLRERFSNLMNMLFSFEWSRTVHPGVFYAFYYLSFRNDAIQKRFREMFKNFRDYLADEFWFYKKAGIISVENPSKAADIIITLIEGLEFHAGFLSNGQTFESFAESSKNLAITHLKVEPEETSKQTG
jgi:AcrR family transcriptional regulator